jgi:Membrane proteins related to metalloendopeptidases
MKHNNRSFYKELIFLFTLLVIVLVIFGYELRLLSSEYTIKSITSHEIDYDKYRNYYIDDKLFNLANQKVSEVKKRYPALKNNNYANQIGYLTFSMMANSYRMKDTSLVDENTFCRGIGRIGFNAKFKELYQYNQAILKDLVCFPVPKIVDQKEDVNYSDSWSQPRTYGGNRKHEGTDLMASNNKRGFFPVVSITDGTIEKMGWLDKGGYRIGIRSASQGYFYYAHLDSYAPELKEGDTVIAGQLLGFMGDSGYGSEGTIGKFDVHLHLGIYVNTKDGEMSVNPYYVLQILKKNRTKWQNGDSNGSLLR